MEGEPDEIDRALVAFRGALRVPFREDARLSEELCAEAAPVIDALAFAIRAAGGAPSALEYREGLAMGALLGRRAALQRATPTVSLVLADAIVAALAELGLDTSDEASAALRAVLVEGYCAAIEERIRDDASARAAGALVPWRIAPRCWLILVAGEHAPEPLVTAMDRACRALLDADARSCLVHVAIAGEATEDLAAEIFGWAATARMIGVDAVFSGVDARWREAARARLDPSDLALCATFEEGLGRALELAGAELRESSPIVRRLRRLLGGAV